MTGGSIKENLKKPSLPSDWSIKKLRELCSQIQDGTHFTPQYVEYGIPFYSVESVTARNFLVSKYVTQEAHDVMAKRCRPQRGDILMTRIGSLGDTAVVDWDHEASIYVSLALLRPGKAIDEAYLYAYTRSKAFVTEVESRSLPNAIPKKINLGDIGDVEIWVPDSLHEQQAIAAALSDADGVVAGLERVIAKKRLIKQGAMQDLLTARRRLPGFSGEWEEATISDVAHVDPEALGAGTPKDYAFRYISLEDVNQGVLSGWTDVAFGSAPSRARRILQKDDVLLGTVRPNLKSHMLFDRLSADWVGSTGFAVLRPRPEKCIPGFLFELIMSDVIGRQIDEVIAGSNYPAISNSDVRKLKVMLPSIDEQKAIAAVLRDMDAEIQTLESRLSKARAVKEGMMQNLLTGRVRLV